jgi:hypothetical protein
MSKKPNASKPENGDALKAFGTPPLLSEKLIAQLQGAVNAAQRKRSTQSERLTKPHTKLTADES